MKRAIAEDGTRTHTLSATEKKALRSSILVVDQLAFFHRDTNEGAAMKALCEQLQFLHNGETLVDEPPPEIIDELPLDDRK